MKVVGIIQARMSSRRLPNKVLLPLCDEPVLAHVVKRTRACPLIDDVWIATSTEKSDDLISKWARENNVKCYRGSLDDVLDRYVKTAKIANADAVVRITADCPAIDPEVITKVVEGFIKGDFDYYGLAGSFPDGLDCSVFSYLALERAWREAKLPSEREHVGPYIQNHSDYFKLGELCLFDGTGIGHHRWTLDEPEDYHLLKLIFNSFQPGHIFKTREIIEIFKLNPSWISINNKINRNEGYQYSLQKDNMIDNQKFNMNI
jgi:spore coat polysaccharide biosynthesis protein SpsF (cytidylyltransferase family)